MSNRPSGESVSAPSEEALPLMISALAPLSGIAVLLTIVPLVANWSMNTELPWLPRVSTPSPARNTAILPGTN